MDILVDVVNQRLQTATNLTNFIAGTQEFIRFVFNLDSDWENLLTFAQFTQNGESYNQYLDEENSVYLPSEITQGTCTLMLFGSYENKKAITNYLKLEIEENMLAEDVNSTQITLSLYDQLATQVHEISTWQDTISIAYRDADADLQEQIDVKANNIDLIEESNRAKAAERENAANILLKANQSQVDNLAAQFDYLANSEVVASAVNESVATEIARYITNGTLSNMTIEDNSISRGKVDNNFEETLSKADNSVQIGSQYPLLTTGDNIFLAAKSESDAVNSRVDNISNQIFNWETSIAKTVQLSQNIRYDIDTEAGTITVSQTGTVASDAIIFCKDAYNSFSTFGGNVVYDYAEKISTYSGNSGTWAFVADTVNGCFALRRVGANASDNNRIKPTDWIIFVLHLLTNSHLIYSDNKIIYSNNVYIDGELQSAVDTSSAIGIQNSWFCLKSNPSNAARATMKIIAAVPNTHYRFLISDTQNITDFVTVCIFSDNTYTRLDTKNVSSDDSSFFVDVTTSENAAYLRFNAKIGSNGTVGSLTLTEFTGDSHSIEGRVTTLENREVGTNKTIGIIDSWFCLKSNPGENVQARMKEFEVEPSTHYRFLINNTENISKINTVCLFNTYDLEHPNDYTVLDRHTVTVDGSSFFIDVDTPSNGAILLFNALMPSSGVGSFTLTQFSSETATIDERVKVLENRETLQNTRLSDIESVNTIQNTNITNINNTLTTWDTAISNIVEYVNNIRFDISTELDLTTDPNNPVKPFIRISRTGIVPKDAILFCKSSYGALSGFGIAENASPAETTYIYYDKIQQYSSSATGTWAFVADTVNQCFAMRKLNVSPSSDDRLRSTDWVVFVLHLQHSTGKIYAGNKIIYSNNVYIDGELQSAVDTSSAIGIQNSWFCLRSKPSNNRQAIMKIIPVTPNTHYRFLISEISNVSNINTVCLFASDLEAYSVLHRATVVDNSNYWIEVTTPDDANKLRFNAVIPNSGVGSFTLTQFSNNSYTIDSRIRALENREILTNKTTCKIFKKVVCCGDSYTAGYIDIHGSGELQTEGTNYSKINEDYSWVHYMSTMTGNNWVNCGVSGSNVLTWRGLYDEHYANYYSNEHPSDSTIIIGHENTTYKDKVYSNIGYDAAVQAGQTQAYVIGLLINDSAPVGNDHHVDLGESSDIGAEYPTTFYGGLSKIIRDLHSISPKAKIFVNTCPKNDSSNRQYSAYNQAVRDVVDYYKNNYAYPVHCIDLANHSDLYSNSSLIGDYINGHYTAIGYEQFAEIYALLLSDYINTHISEFQDVAFIPITNGNGA